MLTALAICGVAFVATLLWKPGRMLMKSQLRKYGEKALDVDPVAVLKQGIDDAIKVIAGATANAAELKAHVVSLRAQRNDSQQKVATLKNRLQKLCDAKDETRARQYALQYKSEQDRLAGIEQQLEFHEKNYTKTIEQIAAKQVEIKNARERSRNLGAELKSSEIDKALREKFSSSELNVNLDNLHENEQRIRDKINRNLAVGTVADDINSNLLIESDFDDHDDEIAGILAEFRQPVAELAVPEPAKLELVKNQEGD